jgi:glycosyltransferase involved in cell wall biosynthesis
MSQFITQQSGLPHLIGAPIGLPPFIPSTTQVLQMQQVPGLPPPEIPGQGLPRAINYLADYGGCSWYRCMAPNLMLNLYQKAVMLELTTMVLDPRFYAGVKAVKIQRQATPIQRDFVKMLKQISSQMPDGGFKIIYEIDDIVFREDIPDFNRNKDAFVADEIRDSILEILSMCDEVTVTCDFMKDYFNEKMGVKKTTVIPNYLLRWWFDRYYNLDKLVKNFEKNKKKPIVSIFASGTHVDVTNRANQKDDFEMVVPAVIKTRKDFKWRFYGCYPLPLKPYIDRGEIEFHQWAPLPEFPGTMADSGTQLTFAALQDNNFNRAKSNIKLLEAAALGIPCVCPDMCTYKDAFLKYSNVNEFIDCIKTATKNQHTYADLCKKSRAYADNFWLEDEKNLMKHHEAYFTPFGSPDRKYLLETNPKL